MPISKGLLEFVELLNSNRVDYVVVGAWALAWHGYSRYTADLDILIRTGELNSSRALAVLADSGI